MFLFESESVKWGKLLVTPQVDGSRKAELN